MVRRVPLTEILETAEEIDFIEAIDNFRCQDQDVERFLKGKAVDFDKRNKSRTYLLVNSTTSSEIMI